METSKDFRSQKVGAPLLMVEYCTVRYSSLETAPSRLTYGPVGPVRCCRCTRVVTVSSEFVVHSPVAISGSLWQGVGRSFHLHFFAAPPILLQLSTLWFAPSAPPHRPSCFAGRQRRGDWLLATPNNRYVETVEGSCSGSVSLFLQTHSRTACSQQHLDYKADPFRRIHRGGKRSQGMMIQPQEKAMMLSRRPKRLTVSWSKHPAPKTPQRPRRTPRCRIPFPNPTGKPLLAAVVLVMQARAQAPATMEPKAEAESRR